MGGRITCCCICCTIDDISVIWLVMVAMLLVMVAMLFIISVKLTGGWPSRLRMLMSTSPAGASIYMQRGRGNMRVLGLRDEI